MYRLLTAIAAIIVSCLSWAIDARTSGSTLLVNERKVHTFATPFGGMTPEKRALDASSVVRDYKSGDVFSKKKVGENWQVLMGKRIVVTITPKEAQASKVAAAALAASVTQRLSEAAKLPALMADVQAVELPATRTATIKLSGWGVRKATIEASNQGLLSVKRTENQLTVRPLKTGSTSLRIYFNQEQLVIPVTVLPWAFHAHKPLTAQVIGSPADKIVVAGAVSAAIQTRAGTPVENQVWVKVLDAVPIKVGDTAVVRARVKAIGSGFYPFDGVVAVRVSNVDADMPREDELWYSNEPEQVEKPGRLYWGELTSGRTTRLLYHHQSAYQLPQVIRYMVANPTDKTAVLAIALGDSNPDKNPTRAGYIAGDQFLMKWLSRSAEIVEVPAHTVVPITVRRLTPGETCSGLASIALRKGGAEKIVVIGDSVMQQTLYDDWRAGQSVIGAWHAVSPKPLGDVRISLDGEVVGVFPQPYKEERLDYEVGGRFGFTRIGEVPIKNQVENTSLLGNFGVIYDIQGTLTNSTPAPAEVEVLFEASAGYGSGLFLLNGDMVRIGLIQPKREIVLASIKLPPGAIKPLRIQTMPLSGANYPVTLIVRPIGIELAAHKR